MIVGNILVARDIAKAKAAYEAELKEKGIMPQEPKRRPKREIYLPIDRTGQANRADSTEMFLRSAEQTFGQKQEEALSVVDYGAQVDNYQQRVDAIKKAESRRLAQQQAQRDAYDRKLGRTPQPKASNLKGANTNGTRINRLKTSSLNTKSSTYKR